MSDESTPKAPKITLKSLSEQMAQNAAHTTNAINQLAESMISANQRLAALETRPAPAAASENPAASTPMSPVMTEFQTKFEGSTKGAARPTAGKVPKSRVFDVPVPPDYEQVKNEVLNERFKVKIEQNSGEVYPRVSIIVPLEYGTLSDAQQVVHRRYDADSKSLTEVEDRRTRTVRNIDEFRAFCQAVRSNVLTHASQPTL